MIHDSYRAASPFTTPDLSLLSVLRPKRNTNLEQPSSTYMIRIHMFRVCDIIHKLVSIAEQSEASTVFGCSDVEITGSNLAQGMDVCLCFSVLRCPVCR
jgi:hypothetical protein